MRNSKLIAFALGILLSLTVADAVFAAEPLPYTEIQQRGSVLVDQVNQVREPNVSKKYFLYKVAYNRSLTQANEKDATGTSEFEHDLGPLKAKLAKLDICWNWIGENIGFSNTLRTSPKAATADDIVDRWEASPTHNAVLKTRRADWGGGSWVSSDSGTYFFVYYAVDVCGI